MISELKQLLKNFQEQRPVKQSVIVYGNYSNMEKEAIYNDAEQHYEISPYLKFCENVSTVKSFVDFIKEELKRRGKEDGDCATVVIDSKGGRFTADDNFQRGNCVFERTLSQQWETFRNCLDRTYDHEDFLRLMQKLSPSIEDFKELYPKFLDIRIVGRAEAVSKPFYVNGECETGIKISCKMHGGADEESVILPENFKVKLPYAKGNYEKMYETELNLVFDNRGGVNILVQCPLFEQVEETALLDEVKYLKVALKDYKKLSVLFNF